ncbi:MAG: hypothetical protein L6Q35_14230, partial [Phycisphaerales bacterium]|nr:hypothetical protein [Phycisphaerales bacterium]
GSSMTTVTRPIHFAMKARRRRVVRGPKPDPVALPGRVPRVARLMALAIRYDDLLRRGVVGSQTDLARFCHVTQPRMTQILNLLHLAPDIQEEILFLPPVTGGRDAIHEHMLRPVTSAVDWREQRRRWAALRRG